LFRVKTTAIMDDLFRATRAARRMGRALQAVASEPVERACGLSPKELVMLHAFEGGAVHPHELKDRTGVAAPLVTRALDRLAEAGYVERRPDTVDRRRVVVVVTEAGSEAATAGWTALGEVLDHVLSDVPTGAFARLAEDMEGLAAIMETHEDARPVGSPA
jgi:MarR family transcriptional regulator, organic hydroperoxide resistance regulator